MTLPSAIEGMNPCTAMPDVQKWMLKLKWLLSCAIDRSRSFTLMSLSLLIFHLLVIRIRVLSSSIS